MSSLRLLSDQDLLEVYFKAQKYNLEKQFIETIFAEIKLRGLVRG
ncbi:sporulation histidine kinase inhibitor Sda [Bacillus sp. DNRA2]|nr:sporulation histidine kinase inhibitor Sda [Bacillus sp. DNRA2]NMD68821.1 sporulation histidine kinase inhibitor Sda [Bacillus sp. DNRA2]